MSKDETGYNGWKNYESWVTNLWLTNDEVSYNYLFDLAKETPDKFELSKTLKNDTMERFYDIQDDGQLSGVFVDLLNASISMVDWVEIAEHAIQMVEE